MSGDNFAPSLALVLKEEGGFTANPKDPGNWTGGKVGKGTLKGTKFGIAASSHPHLDIANLTITQAGGLYRFEYWDRAECDKLPAGVDLSVFDPSVNSGVSRGVRYRDETAGAADPVARVRAIGAKRRAFYQGLSTFRTFGKGWLTRVARIEAAATRMALEGAGHTTEGVRTAMAKVSLSAGVKAKKSTAKAHAAAGGAVAGSPASVAQVPDVAGVPHLGAIVAVVIAVVAVGVVVVLIQRARSHRAVATAFAAQAAAVPETI